jgi:hypothetical protein
MSWETRKRGTSYYTRSKRRDGRVVRQYVGVGRIGELAAEGDRIDRERREIEALEEKEDLERLGALVSPVAALGEAARILAGAHLIAGGYHRHKGQWRRARAKRDGPA